MYMYIIVSINLCIQKVALVMASFASLFELAISILLPSIQFKFGNDMKVNIGMK